MSTLDKVIGYECVKTSLFQIIDMIRNREVYEKLGARLPRGAILCGESGIGKTLLATSFIEESGLPSFTVRKNKVDGFVNSITDAFEKAKKAPRASFFSTILINSPMRTSITGMRMNMLLFRRVLTALQTPMCS